ncbi:MAG: hypothetical protein RI973_1327 [Bacteroidota bacterium]|jgi:hypothetical protein
MKKNILKHAILLAAIAVLAASFASCNKGYGCPNNFKAAIQSVR